MARPSVITRRQDRSAAHVQSRALEKGTEREADRKCVDKISFLHDLFIVLMRILLLHCRKSHIFDGKTVTKETAAFQLCDIVDPMLKEMIEDTNDLRETCHVRLFSPAPSLHTLSSHSLTHTREHNRNATDGTPRMPSSASKLSCDTNSSLCSTASQRQTRSVRHSWWRRRVLRGRQARRGTS
jgi:hypothetical protein